jgi:hypothetical protein
MTAPQLSFCPFCGAALLAPEQCFCASCGREFPRRETDRGLTSEMVASAGTADPLVEPAGPVNGPTVDELVRAEPPLPEEAIEAAEAPRETVASSVVVQLDPTPPPGQEPHAPDVAEIAASLRPSMPGRIPPAPVSPQPLGSIPLALRQMGDWAELRRLTRASLPVIGGWLAMVLVVGTLTAQTLTTSVTDQLLG